MIETFFKVTFRYFKDYMIKLSRNVTVTNYSLLRYLLFFTTYNETVFNETNNEHTLDNETNRSKQRVCQSIILVSNLKLTLS